MAAATGLPSSNEPVATATGLPSSNEEGTTRKRRGWYSGRGKRWYSGSSGGVQAVEQGVTVNEAKTRAESIDPALKNADWGVAEGSRILREYHITPWRIVAHRVKLFMEQRG